MKNKNNDKLNEVVNIIAGDRHRTNLLRNAEQKTIAYLVQRIPGWLTSDMLTAIGFSGNLIILASFVLARFQNINYLLFGVLGFAISWFGDSLDGRLAYYRNKQRKWYGFALDITVDWIGVAVIGFGFILYVSGFSKLLGFFFVILYGWEMLTAMLRYKISDKYSIDSGILGPTEVRIVISLFLITEVLFKHSILLLIGIACVILFISNIIEMVRLLKMANEKDRELREKENNK